MEADVGNFKWINMKDELQGLFTYETMFYVVNVLDGLKINQ